MDPTDSGEQPAAVNLTKLQQKIAERRAAKEVETAHDNKAQWDKDLIPEVGEGTGLSEYNQALDAACATITLKEVYDKLSKGQYERGHEKRSGESVKISCPVPGHRDSNPSAWMNTEKDLGNCFVCNQGFDKYTVAAWSYGLDPKADFYRTKKRLALELRGLVEPDPKVIVIAERPKLSVVPDEDDVDMKDQSKYPTYDLADVGLGDSFLVDYTTEALKAAVPREFPLWAGLMVLSSTIGRRIALSKIESPTYGNLAVCLTSGSASGKGRSTRPAVAMLRRSVPFDDTPMLGGLSPTGTRIIQLPGSGEALVDELDIPETGPDGKPTGKHWSTPALVEFEEIQYLVGKSMNSAYKSYIIAFADCLAEVSRSSLRNGKGKVTRGYVTFLTATQPGHLKDQFTGRDLASGLLNRFVFPFGRAVPRQAWGTPHQDWTMADMRLRQINHWLDTLTPNNPEGNEYWITEADWEDDARDTWIEFFNRQINADVLGPHSDLLGRMDQNMLRLILLFAVNDMSTVIRVEHVRSAFALYDYISACALMLAREVNNSEMSENMSMILEAVTKHEAKAGKPASTRDIRRGSAQLTQMNEEQFTSTIARLLSSKQLVACTWRTASGRGRPGSGYSIDPAQYSGTALNVASVSDK